MCGICGFNWRDDDLMERMVAAMGHRGPDARGIYSSSSVSLGHTRLSIIDLSRAASQPMWNDDNTVCIVYNGEIYNYRALRAGLEDKGYTFRTQSDTEVVLKLYEDTPVSFLDKMQGMFAFAIHDTKRRITVLVRDRFGIKPLYYYWRNGKFIFASEIKPLLFHDIPRVPHQHVMRHYLDFNIVDHSTSTFFQDIYKVAPGEFLVYHHDVPKLQILPWYDFKFHVFMRKDGFHPATIDDKALCIRNGFTDAVQSHLVSDVPVGSCLSGGIDSTSIVAMMRKLDAGAKISTFSLTFDGYAFDETNWIDTAVKEIGGIDSHCVTPTLDMLERDLHDLMLTQEEPFGSLSIYGQYCVMRLAHEKGLKVLLDGQGADEIFGGYQYYYKYKFVDDLYAMRWRQALKSLRWIHADERKIVGAEMVGRLGSLRPHVSDIIRQKYGECDLLGVPLLSTEVPTLQWALMRDIQHFTIPQLLRFEDKNSMRWSVESRVPFLHHPFAEFAMTIDPVDKIVDCKTKFVFRKAMKGILPETIRRRKDKIGYQAPDEIWMLEPWFAHEVVDAEVAGSLYKYWDSSILHDRYREHAEGKANHARYLWRVVNANLWLRAFIEEGNWFDQTYT